MIGRWVMMLALNVCSAAGAVEVERFPMVGDLSLPSEGVSRIHVPLELRGAEDPDDASDMVLLNGAGEPVPWAVVKNTGPGTSVDWKVAGFEWRAMIEENQFRLSVSDLPVDYVEVALVAQTVVATARVDERVDGQWSNTGIEVVIWEQGSWQDRLVPLPHRLGEYRLRLQPHRGTPKGNPEIHGYRYLQPTAPPDLLTVPVQSWWVNDQGWTRYLVDLDRPLPMSRVKLHTSVDVFQRDATVIAIDPWDDDASVRSYGLSYNLGRIQRLMLGAAHLDQVWVSANDVRTNRIAIDVSTKGEAALPIDTVTVEVPGLHLLVRDPGAGPFQLYAGAPEGTAPTWELQVAAAELDRLSGAAIEVEHPRDNPDYRPPEVRGNLSGPGTVYSVRRMTTEHEIVGDAGLVRVGLTPGVLVEARPDLGDLRVLDPDGRQIPYLLRRRGGEHPLEELTFERREEGSRSFLSVTLPTEGLPLSSVTLSTDAPLFSRRVTVFRTVGAELDPVRTYDWVGSDRPSQVTLQLHQTFTDQLVVAIDNGDDPPLPVSAIKAAWPAWEVVTTVPEAGARLVYGDHSASRPHYDLALLKDEVERRATRKGELGPPATMINPTSMFDTGVVLMGVAVLVLGLLALIVGVIMGGGSEEDPELTVEPAPS